MSDVPLLMDEAISKGIVSWRDLLTNAVTTVSIGILTGLPWLFDSCYLLGFVGYSCLVARAARQTYRRALAESFASGFIALAIAFNWAANSIEDTTNLGQSLSIVVFLSLVLWEATAFAWLGLASRAFASRSPRSLWLVVPMWVTIEFYWPKVFDWATAHAYLGFTPVLQVAEVAGTSGVTAFAVLGSVATSRVWLHPKDRSAIFESALAFGVISAVCIWGVWQINRWQQKTGQSLSIRVAAVQVDPSFVNSLEQLQTLSDRVDGQVNLLLWPESTLGNYYVGLDYFGDESHTYANSEMPNPAVHPYPNIHCDLLAGGKTYDDGGRGKGPYKNTVFLINDRNRVLDRYVKRTLMPLGEYVPGEMLLPVLRDWAAIDVELVRGTSDAPLQLSCGNRVGVLVCFEDMVASNASLSVLNGAECLVALANGSAFKDPDTLLQHLKLAQLRTIENRRAMIRCAATGVTCLIGPDGQINERLPIGKNGLLVTSVPLSKEITFYTQYGNWFAHSAAFLSLVSLAGLVLQEIKASPYR